MIGLHVIESIIGAGEVVFVTIALFVRPDKRHFADAQMTALFWFFVVGIWIPLFALIYGDGAYG
jgi:heme/copper-type cytochrome/quinol oxidase subunit 3